MGGGGRFWQSVEQWATVYRGAVQYIYTVCDLYSAVYFGPMEQWTEKGRGITHVRTHATTRITAATLPRHSLKKRVFGFVSYLISP